MSDDPRDDTAPDEVTTDAVPGSTLLLAEPGEPDPDLPAAGEPSDDPLRRIGRRIVRRPTEWLHRPWPAERLVQYFTAVTVLLGCTLAIMKVVHLDLIFSDNTPTGGDMGAHVLGPAELRDNLLPHFQLSGWSNSWYNGFPLYRFYMLPPALLIVLLNVIMPYGIAFKVVVVLGIFTLPFSCWAFGRLARFRYPVPELMALAAMLFLFDESFSIYGGNVKSTMAGEFSFSIALSLGILGLGLFARGLETGKHRGKAAMIIALAMLSHGLVMLVWPFLLLIMWLVWMDRTRFVYGLTTLLTAGLLTAFWSVPFLLGTKYMTDMKYGFRPSGPNDSFWDMFFPWTPFLDLLVTGFALVGFVVAVMKRNLNGAFLGIACIFLMAFTYVAKDSLPIIGLLWNPRLLPFLYLLRLLLMMYGIAETARFLVRGVQMRPLTVRTEWITGLVTFCLVGSSVLVGELFLFREMPGAVYRQVHGQTVYSWGIGDWYPITLTASSTDALSDGWPRYNFEGYEGRPYYGEYYDLVRTMDEIGADDGCGRALWENNGDTGLYGTTMALMLLPHWTDGCISSSEGLFFEASGTTPYHFLTAAAMSDRSSNPVRELRYTDNNAAVGVPLLQKMGIRYVMVFTDAAKRQADTRPELTLLAEVGPWKIYQVADSDVVVPLTVQPVVVNERGGDQRERHLELGTSWFQNPEDWAALPANDGPPEWQRIDVEVDQSRVSEQPKRVDIVVPAESIDVVNLPEITVSNYVMGEQDLSFDVSQVGVPVLVKVSYYPNWEAEGADGPYWVAPNFMVVVPRSTHVRLSFEKSTTDYLAYFLTFFAIGLLVLWRVKGDVVHASPHPFMIMSPSGGSGFPPDDGEDGGSLWELVGGDGDPPPDDQWPDDERREVGEDDEDPAPDLDADDELVLPQWRGQGVVREGGPDHPDSV